MAPLIRPDAPDHGAPERRRTLLVVADSAVETDEVRAELSRDWYVVGCAATDVWVAARSIRFDLVLVLGAPAGAALDRLLDAEVGLVPEALAFAPTAALARWAVERALARTPQTL